MGLGTVGPLPRELCVGLSSTSAAPGTVREKDILGCMERTEVKHAEQSPGSWGRLSCLTLLSFSQPPGLDQP